MFLSSVDLFCAYSPKEKKSGSLKDGPTLYNFLGGIEVQGFIP